MALDDLKATIKRLQERIQAHRPYLERNETRTRQVLIDPLLRALGWDAEDPNFVQLEYGIGGGWADYALMVSGQPIAVIEAKALGKSLDERETMQALNYANTAGISYMALTNGDHWRMLEVFRQGPIEDRILMDFQLTRDEPYACALQALGIWRPNLASSDPREAATPVMVERLAHSESSANQPVPSTPEPSRVQETVDPSTNGDWMPLTSLQAKSGQKPPAYIKFPDSSTRPLKDWRNLLESIARHLVETGKLSARDCPVSRVSKSRLNLVHTRYLVHTDRFIQTARSLQIRNKSRSCGCLMLFPCTEYV